MVSELKDLVVISLKFNSFLKKKICVMIQMNLINFKKFRALL